MQAGEAADPLLDHPAAWHLELSSTGQGADRNTPAGERLDLPELTRAGRFRLLGEIARGGMGVVLRAHDPEMDRPLAVKAILPQHRRHPSLRDRPRRPRWRTGHRR